MSEPFVLVIWILAALILQAFFSMTEMSIVSFNKVRLQYYVGQGSKRAKWLSKMLKNPARLFGTTLIGVNLMLQFSSECARRFYFDIGVSPDWSALSQTILILIFAELSPLFAARRYAEHVAMLVAPIIYVLSIIMTPIIVVFNALCYCVNRMLGIKAPSYDYLTREELQRAIEEREENVLTGQFDQVAENIFQLKGKKASDLMVPVAQAAMIPSGMKVSELKTFLQEELHQYLPIYHKREGNIVGVAYPRDLIRANAEEKVRDHARAPWLIAEDSLIGDVLSQFRQNAQSVAIVLDDFGHACGILYLDDIVEDLFGYKRQKKTERPKVHIDRAFSSKAKVSDINKKLKISLDTDGIETLEDLMIKHLGHRPMQGESITLEGLTLTMLDTGLLRGKRIRVRSV